MRQTILGSGGAIGIPLGMELAKYTGIIRLVSRNPVKINNSDELFPADLTDPAQVDKAIEGSDVVYVTVGFQYNLKVWRKTWPPFIKSVVDGCIKHGAKLVFFDNLYVYDRKDLPDMTESASINPPSEKGKVRKEVLDIIYRAAETGNLKYLVARSADFYGPYNRNSILTIMVADRFMKGNKAQVFGNPSKIHNFTYTPDAAKATALLGNSSDTWNQVWHLPTTSQRITMNRWIELISGETGSKPEYSAVPAFMINLLGIFVPVMREFPEMLYQYETDYFFNSSKFEKRFGITATSPEEGIRNTIDYLKSQNQKSK